jgi:integrase
VSGLVDWNCLNGSDEIQAPESIHRRVEAPRGWRDLAAPEILPTLRIMWNSAVAWKYVTGELRVELPKARKLRMRCYAVEEVKRILAHTKGADRVFSWLAAESGLRAGELIALRESDVDVEKLSVEVTKAIWNGSEDNPKTEAAFRSVCISSRLGSQVKEYLAGRTDGYLFQTSSGNPWGASNVLERKLNTVLERLDN